MAHNDESMKEELKGIVKKISMGTSVQQKIFTVIDALDMTYATIDLLNLNRDNISKAVKNEVSKNDRNSDWNQVLSVSLGKNFGPLNESETVIKNILEKMAESSKGEKKELLNKIGDTVYQINIDELNLVLDSQGLKKAVNKREFMEVIEKGLENLKSEDVTPKIVKNALKSVNDKALSSNVNKGPLGKLGDNFKTLSIDKKIGIVAAGVVVTAIFSPLIALATLIALVSIGARHVGIGAKKAGEEIKAKSIETGKTVTSVVKDVMDKLPTFQARESNFDNSNKELDHLIVKTNGSPQFSASERKEAITQLLNTKEIVKMLQNKEQQSAIKELVKDRGFSEDDMKRLMEKGRSTHQTDKEAFDNLLQKLKPEIMAIGGGEIDKVKQEVDKQVNEMKKPDPNQLNNPNASQVGGQKKSGPAMGG